MERKFRVLRTIGALWKVLAWITLIGGILFSLGILLVGVLGSGGAFLRLLGRDPGVTMPGALGLVSSIMGFVIALISTIIYFLILYAVGELIYLLLSIEANTRQTVRLMQRNAGAGAERPASPSPPEP